MSEAEALKEIAERLTIMFASAKCYTNPADDDVVTGYKIKTGSIHRIIGILAGMGYPVMIPVNLALADEDREFKNIAEWKAHYQPNDFVLGDNTRNIADVVTPESVAKALRLGDAVKREI